jgi:hypothetical protein
MAQIYKIDTDQHQQRRRDDSRIRLSVGFVAGTVWTGYFRQEGER